MIWFILLIALGAWVGLTHQPPEVVFLCGVGWWGAVIYTIVHRADRMSRR